MIIQIDTNNLSDTDVYFLQLLLDPENTDRVGMTDGQIEAQTAAAPNSFAAQAQSPAKPTNTRTRRTKLEIAFDEALARYEGPNTGDGSDWKAFQEAAEALKAKDPQNERFQKHYAGPDSVGESTPVSTAATNMAEAAAALTEALDGKVTDEEETSVSTITVEQVTTLAAGLIQSNRAAMVEILKTFGARRVSEIPEDRYAELADAIRNAPAA